MNNNLLSIDESAMEDRKSGISSNCSCCLKGFFAVCVLIHHLYQRSGLFHQTVIGGGFKQ